MQVGEAGAIKVFLVADQKIVLWGLEQLVKSAAPRMGVVGVANSYAEFHLKLQSVDPDVVVLDLDIGVDHILDSLEKTDRQFGVQILALTGSNDQSIHQRAIIGGVRGIIQKHQSVDVILRAIEKVNDGEIWLDRFNLGHVMHTLSRGNESDLDAEKIAKLTVKERQIVNTVLVEKSGPGRLIAERLHMSEHTLRNHLTTIYKKLNVNGRMELYLYASSHANLVAPK